MTVYDLQRALYFYRDRPLALVNTHLLIGESDFVEVTQAGFVYEYEIKLSVSDFRADFRKQGTADWQDRERREYTKHDIIRGHRPDNMRGMLIPKRFYFVVPDGLISASQVPDPCGLIVGIAIPGGYRAQQVKRAKDIKGCSKLTIEQYRSIAHKASLRFFNLFCHRNGGVNVE